MNALRLSLALSAVCLAPVISVSACSSTNSTSGDAGGPGITNPSSTGQTSTGFTNSIPFGGTTGTAGSSTLVMTTGPATTAATTGTATATASASNTVETTATSMTSTSPTSSSGSSELSSTSETTASTATGSSATSPAGDGGTCFKPPDSHIYAETAAGVYCPFSATAGGENVTCAAGQVCCETPESAGTPSTCIDSSATCPVTGSTTWACEGAPDCASMTGTVCCGTGTIDTQPAQPGCGDAGAGYPAFPYVHDFKGTSCKASCTTYQVCSQSSECPSDHPTCTPIEPQGNGIGYCQ